MSLRFLSNRLLPFFIVTLLISETVFAAGKMTAREWLDQMSHSFREQNYSGVLSYQVGNQTQSLRVTHAVYDKEEYERLEYLDGDKRQFIRRGLPTNCLHPGQKLIRLYPSSLQSSNIASLDSLYNIKIVGKQRIANRSAIVIGVTPLDAHRLEHRLFLDKQTGLLLKSELRGEQDQLLERFQFVDVKIGEPIDKSLFNPTGAAYELHHECNAEQTTKAKQLNHSWQVSWLPKGFNQVDQSEQGELNKDMATFTDGLAVFSIFLEPVQEEAPKAKSQRGATVAYSQAIKMKDMPYRVTVVGEIPTATAQQVAGSVAVASR